MKTGKTVKDLIEYLKTKDPKTSVAILYDGMFDKLNAFENKGVLVFSNHSYTSEYEEAKIEFTTEDKLK